MHTKVEFPPYKIAGGANIRPATDIGVALTRISASIITSDACQSSWF